MKSQKKTAKTGLQKTARILTLILIFACLPILPVSQVMAAAPQVICVPQVPADLLVPHDTWSGAATILKAIAKDNDYNLIGGTYYWEYGDGGTSAPQTITNPDDLSTTHTYNAAPGTLFIARLHVTDTGGESSVDDYRLIIRQKTLDVEINNSIDDGLWWLYTHRETTESYTIIPNPVLFTPTGDPGLLGEYFNNTSFSGDPVLTRTDPQINFYWGNGSPETGINSDYFSVRWTGEIQIDEAGEFLFRTYTDDGIRFYIDGNLVISNWTIHGSTYNYSIPIYLASGRHDIKVEFYEAYGGARMQLYWSPNVLCKWSNDGYVANPTASAVQAFEINGHLESGDPNEDPYVNVVRAGIDYLMTRLTTQNMSPQAGEHPEDYNNDGDGTNDGGNGIGLSVNSGRPIYELGAVMDAFVASGTQDAMARTGGANVLGRTYQDIVQDMVDMYAWGQDDSGGDLGGWRYSWNNGADNSASQWGAIGMIAAERHFSCIVPDWVKVRNLSWLNASRISEGGFGYTGPGYLWGRAETRIAETASGMIQLAFDGIKTDNPLWIGAQNILDSSWSSLINFSYESYYAWYAIAKAMRLALPQEIVQLPSGLDWYGDDSQGLARILVDRQQSGGLWPAVGLPGGTLRSPLTTSWNVIILTRTLFEKPPVAVIQAQPNPGAIGQTIYFDATASYHIDPAKQISQYLWDFDASDGVDFIHPDATGPMVEHAFGELHDYTVNLKVLDNSTPARFDTGSATIQITIPPHPPTAVIGGPYLATVGEAIQVDGSGSYDIDENQGDSIVTWEWEADFVAPYDFNEATGQITTLPAFTAAGRKDIALRVTDNTAVTFPQTASPDLSSVDYGTVIVYEAGVTDLRARPKATKCQLTWTHIAAPIYEILRSESGPNHDFALIGTTASTYSTYIDYNVVMYKDYWYRIRCEIDGETKLSGPVYVYSQGRIRNRPPIITSTPLLIAQEQQPYSYALQAEDPEGTRLTYLLDAAPAGMVINPATGLISWTPTRDQTGLNEVMVRVNDARRASATQFFQIVVSPRANTAPTPTTDGPYSGLVNEALTFNGSAFDPEGDPIAEYRWVFGDGSEAFGQTVTHAYAADGTYIIALYATDDRGATGHIETRCQTGLANRPPLADAGGPYVGEVNQPVTVDGSQSFDPDGDSMTYTWNYDTVTGPQTGVQVDFTFTAVGTYEVTLTVNDGNGGSDTVTVEIVITPPNDPPVSVFTVDTFLWNNLTFDGTGSHDPEGQALTAWTWDFGDGISTTGAMVNHQYTAEGDYTVRLTVTDDKGATGFTEQSVTITHPTPNGAPVIDAGGPYTGPIDTAITLTATGADPDGDPVTFTWSYDGNDTVGETLDLTFSSPGTYTVDLTAVDNFGGTTTAAAQVTAFDPAASSGDVTPPITTITSPVSGTVLNGMVSFTGSVNDDNLVLWVLEYAPTASEQWQTIATGNSNIDNGLLGQLDASLLQDDLYRFRLRAEDANFSADNWIQCEVRSPLKLGQFSLEYIDLNMPLAGIPIKIIRRYDTQNSKNRGDFGYGWKLSATNPEIRETVPVAPNEESLGYFVAEPYRMGTRVYLTDPDGKRIGFTFEPTPSMSLLGTVYTPKFTPDPGVHDRLEVDPITLTLRGDGTYIFFLIGFNYNPSEFRLVRKDGTTYHYNQFSGLKKVSDLNYNELVYTDTGIFHSSGAAIQFNRDSEGRITEIVDPDGNIISYAYDQAGNLTLVTDQEHLTSSYSYYTDPAHYLETITDSIGHQAARYEYDADGRLTAFTNALGDRAEQAYDLAAFSGTFTDGNGNVTEIFYDTNGNIIRKVGPLGGETTFTYDADKNKTSETDANGNLTQFTYDDRGNILTKTDALGNVTTFTYNAFNQITRVSGSSGHTTLATYDSEGNLTQFTNPDGQTATLSYDSSGRVIGFIDFNGNQTLYEYTAGIAPPTRIINPDGTFRVYAYHWSGQVSSMTDETGKTRLRTYDQAGRLVKETDALGNETSFAYAGQLNISKTCPLGYVTNYEYDAANRMTRQINHLGEATSFTYDAVGNRLSVTDAAGNRTQFVYDKLDRLVTTIDPLNMRTTYSYDPAGNLVERVDRNNRRITFAYDALNQLVRETWYEGTTTVNIIDYGHDAVGNQSYIADNFSSLFFSYDSVNHLITADNSGTPGIPAVILTHCYDAMGNRISTEDSMGVRADSSYDGHKRLLSRTWQGTGMDNPVRVDFTYDPFGNRSTMDRFTDVDGLNRVGSTTSSYDDLNRITELTHNVIAGSTASVIADYDYNYNAAGLLTSEIHPAQTFAYSYDASGQLTGATRSVFDNEIFTYSTNGNRNVGYVIGGNNRILSDDSYSYAYDAEGNIISKTESATGAVTTFAYDHRNRLITVAGGTQANDISYTYDALNRRIKATVDGQTKVMVYDGANVWADFDADANLETRYMFGDKADELFACIRPTGETNWYLTDKLGTIRDLVNGEGTLLNHVDYNSFGGILAQSDSNQGDRFMFTGREYCNETGLYYYRGRYYDPILGRFISEDPTGFSGGDFNLYRYINNSPLNGTDPTGEQSLASTAIIYACASIKAVQTATSSVSIFLPPFLAIRDVIKTGHYTKFNSPTWTDKAVDLTVNTVLDMIFKPLPVSPQKCGIPDPAIEQYKKLMKWALNNVWFPKK